MNHHKRDGKSTEDDEVDGSDANKSDLNSGEPRLVTGGLNVVEIDGEIVRRPLSSASGTIQSLLRHLWSVGLQTVPRPEGIDKDNGYELVGFVRGTTFPNPGVYEWRTTIALESAAQLLRSYHDATRSYQPSGDEIWGLDPQEPREVICHGDFAPYNCTMDNGSVVGMFDFDTAHPGPWIDDLAYAAYRFCPLTHPENPDSFGTLREQRERVHRFVGSYGSKVTSELFDASCRRLQRLVDHMLDSADEGNQSFAQHIREGHLALYERDINYIQEHCDYFVRENG